MRKRTLISTVSVFGLLALGCGSWKEGCRVTSPAGIAVELWTRPLDDAGMSEVRAVAFDREGRQVAEPVDLALCCGDAPRPNCEQLAIYETVDGRIAGLYAEDSPDEILLLISYEGKWVTSSFGDHRFRIPGNATEALSALSSGVGVPLKMSPRSAVL